MVFKSDFSFNPRPVTPAGPRSRSVSPKASCCRTACLEDGEVSPSSDDPSVRSSWSSKRSSMTSITYSLRREYHPSVSTVYTEPVIENGPVISPIRIRFNDEGYGFGKEGDDEDEKKGKTSVIKASILRGFHPFPFHSNKAKKAGSAPTSPKSPGTPPVRTSTKPNNQNTRMTVNARFRLFKSATKSTKNSRRPPPLDFQHPSKIHVSSCSTKGVENPPLTSPIKLNSLIPDSEYHDFTKSSEVGVQLLFQTLSEESDREDIPEAKEKDEIFPSCTNHEDIIPTYLKSPWCTVSRGTLPTTGIAKEVASTKHPESCFSVPSREIPRSPVTPPLSPKSQQQPVAKSTSGIGDAPPMPSSPTVQPPTPCSAGSVMSFLFNGDEWADIEDPPTNFCARKPSPATSRKPSVSGSRNSSIATFFCCGQRFSFDRQNSIGLGGLTGDEVEIVDDAESTFYPGIKELKCQGSWLYTNPPDYYSSDDEDDDFEIEETYQEHLLLITQIRKKSTSSLAVSITSTPELTMASSVSSVSSYGQMLAAPPGRRNRRRTASSECIILEALEEMQAVGLEDPGDVEKKWGGLGSHGDMDFGSGWADALWEMDSDEQVRWDWENQHITLIGI